ETIRRTRFEWGRKVRGLPRGRQASSRRSVSRLVQLVLGPAASIAAGGQQDVAGRVLPARARGVHQAAAPARLRVFLPALGTLDVADMVVGLFANGEKRHRSRSP